MVGTLRPGSYRTAQWDQVVDVCVHQLRSTTKDLQLAVWLADALARLYGLTGIVRGLEIVLGLHQHFWSTFYPLAKDGGLEIRAGRLDELDHLLAERVGDCILTIEVDHESHRWWEWSQAQALIEGAGKVKGPEERRTILADAETRKQLLAKAVTKTPREFYENILQELRQCGSQTESLRAAVQGLFEAQPGYREMDDTITGFSELREALQGCRIKVEDILREKAPAPVCSSQDLQDEPIPTGEGLVRSPEGLPLEPENRADTLRRLSLIAAFFHKTEPHSPVAYLVDRAVRWGSMPLDRWLQEVIGDQAVLTNLRATLGMVDTKD